MAKLLKDGLDRVETARFRESWADGIIDLGLGIALLGMAAIWIGAEGSAWLASVIAPPCVVGVVALRARVVENRGGYVRFREERRRATRAQLLAFLALGLGALSVAIAAWAVGASPSETTAPSLAPGLIGILIAIPIGLVALVTGARRFAGYAGVILGASAWAVADDANPGWPLTAGGLVMAMVGAALVARYLRATSADPEEAA